MLHHCSLFSFPLWTKNQMFMVGRNRGMLGLGLVFFSSAESLISSACSHPCRGVQTVSVFMEPSGLAGAGLTD